MLKDKGTMMFSLCVILVMVTKCHGQEMTASFRILEQQGDHMYVGNVARESTLYDSVTMEQFQRMKFRILGNTNAAYFAIDESASTLRTAIEIDREEICPNMRDCVLDFNVAVYLKDDLTGAVDLYKIVKTQVIVEDINDNRPEFPEREVSIAIAENSGVETEHFMRGATDMDRGANNSIQQYVMEPADEMFGLKTLENSDGTSDLNIVVKYPLDRETKSFYQLVIYAIDGGVPAQTGSVKINITIIDQNDNFPVFSKQEYNVSLEENNPANITIVQVTATDADSGDNGHVGYRFSSRTSTKVKNSFNINQANGIITSKAALDFEDQQKWTFKIEAFDLGLPARTSTVTVNVNIVNMNDNYPQININLPPGGAKVSETVEPGSFIAHVAVFDRDDEEGDIKCWLIDDVFRLEDFKIKNNYKVVLNKSLDHEEKNNYEVSIVCEDNGTPPNSNTTSFIVMVEDVNDNAPIFNKQNYELTILEEKFQSMIVQVEAIDRDSGDLGKVTYGFVPSTDGRFKINQDTGLITANSIFDREKDPEIQLFVLAWDNNGEDGAKTSTATVLIKIEDQNDNAPRFPANPLTIMLKEGEPTQSVNLNVTDPDAGLNGQYTLTFPQNDYLSEFFQFNSFTGEIRALKAIDREQIEYFKFWVTAVDKGIPQRSSSAEVVLQIADSNDNIPAITYPNNSNKTKTIPLSAPVGFLIATVQATDKDDGVNAQLLYFIDSGDSHEIFKMDVNTGQIIVAREMSSIDAGSYTLELAVRDNGEPQRTAMASLNVIVEPNNTTTLAAVAEENKQNIMLVAVIVGVTIIISAAIIISIIILRYVDKQNRTQIPVKLKQVNENQFYDIARADESMSGSSHLSKDSDTELLKKRSKKEVSFSLDEECSEMGNNSTLTNVTSFSTVKPSYLSMEYKTPEETLSSSWLCNNSMLSDLSKTDLYTEKELSGLTNTQLHAALRQMTGDNCRTLWLQPVREEQNKRPMPRRADDNHSETSHDTITSDSGRGGSEEDINSNRGQPLSDSEESRQYIYRCNNRQTDKLMPRRPPPPIPVDSYPRNISFSDDSVTANTTIMSSKMPSLSPKTSTFYSTPLKQHQLFTISGTCTKDTFLESKVTTPGMAYSVGDIDTMSEMATTCRDDASTTTSGSYTINPEDLCNEIDELFFKDVIV